MSLLFLQIKRKADRIKSSERKVSNRRQIAFGQTNNVMNAVALSQ